MIKYNKRAVVSITKYNPIYRNEFGFYQKDEWTSISDVGKQYEGKEFTLEDYLRIEEKYVNAFFIILNFFNAKCVKINHLFKIDKKNDFNKHDSLRLFSTYHILNNNTKVKDKNMLEELIKLRLREHIAELELIVEAKNRTEVLFGFDYYMYLKTNINIDLLLFEIEKTGLYCF
jgi:hypothetical protein